MASSARYFDILVIEDDDFYFIGDMGERPPFYATPKPEYFDDYQRACRRDQVATLQRITSQESCTPAMLHRGLTLALAAGSVSCVRELLLRGAPIAERAPENVFSAPDDKQIPLLDALAAQGWIPSHAILMRAIPNIGLLKWCLSNGVNPNHGIKRDTPKKRGGPSYECADALEIAAQAGSTEAIEILIAAGAKIAFGTPLHFAARAAPPDQIPFSAIASQTEEFDTSRIPAMAALIAHGADVNQKEESPHMTAVYPLVYAVQVGAVRRARWLLEHGADPDLKGHYGSAAEYASIMGSEEMKDLFRSRQHMGSE